ncbi:MAG: Gfo/Idh/MocA family oxidoreductase, partial [Chloroflexota bacterium]|nr:Gfo/Idh/MocA family oxidoreductase [Chloroflexota bacterium]
MKIPLAELAELYSTSLQQRRRLSIGAQTVGWGLLGASRMAEQHMVNAIRNQPAVADTPTMAGAAVIGVFSHNERRAGAFAEANQIAHAAVNLDDLLGRRDIQCVYVGSHPRHHAPLTLAALA